MDNIYEVNMLNAIHLREAIESLSILNSFNRGWAHRQNQGKMYGDNFITSFKDDIYDMFERGDIEMGENITAEIMDVDLWRRYTND